MATNSPSKTVESSTRNPRIAGVEIVPGRCYTKVQRDVPTLQYESPLEKFLDMASPTDPGANMYRIESEDSKTTGSRQMVMVSCSQADFDAIQKQEDGEALSRQRSLSKKNKLQGEIKQDEETFVRSKNAILSD